MPEPAIAYLFLFAAGIIASLTRDAIWAVYLYIAVYFVAPWTRWWGYAVPEIRWIQIITITLVVSWLIRRFRYRMQKISSSKPMILLLVFSLIMLAVSPLAVWPERHYFVLDRHWKLVVFLLIMFKVTDSLPKIERILWAYLGGLFYIATVARDLGRTGNGRLDGIGTADSVDVNDLASLYVIGVPVLLFYVMEAKRLWLKGVALLALAWCLNALVLMNSRGAFLGLLIGTGVYLSVTTLSIKRGIAFKFKILAGIVGAAILFVYLADDVFWQRQTTLTTQGEERNDMGRVMLWKAALKLGIEHPLGLGAEGFTALSGSIVPRELLNQNSIRAVHSTYLESFTAYGFAGTAAFFWFLSSSFAMAMRAQKAYSRRNDTYGSLLVTSLMAGFAGFLVSSVFINRLYSEALYYIPTLFASMWIVAQRTPDNHITHSESA